VTRSGEPEQRLTDALRAQATGARHPGVPGGRPAPRGGRGAADDRGTRLALLVALGIGLFVGVLLAAVSLLAPGALPTLG
jgi:hypothetical protein